MRRRGARTDERVAPTVLDELGFYEALSEYLAGLTDAMPFRLEVRLDPGLQKWRSRQDAMLFRLVQEALLNARKHARARRLSVTFGREDREVTLSVEDDGCGFQTGTIPLGHYGLLTMRERAEVSGGTLHVSSEPGRGTCVLVRFPAVMATNVSRIRVYLIDDHQAVRQAVAVMLEAADQGLEVVGQRDDAARGIAELLQLKPDVVIIDLKMPGMSGLSAIAEISAAAPAIRTIVFTMYDNPAYVWETISAGASGYLLKSASKEELVRAVRAVATGARVSAG